MNRLHPDLVTLGDELEHAVARQVAGSVTVKRRRKQRSRATVAGFAVAGVVALGAGAAAAGALLDHRTVETGLPNSGVIFGGTDPSCTVRSGDSEVFDCTLDHAPTVDAGDDFTGRKQSFTDADKKVAGGCIGQDHDGVRWTCYVGERAVEMKIIGRDLLGEYMPEPAAG